jgi:phospholipid-binding lipoprotein MlaA
MKNISNNYCVLHAVLLSLLLNIAGCATSTEESSAIASTANTTAQDVKKHSAPQREFPELKKPSKDLKAITSVYDPIEPFNRSMYNFNAGFDHYVFLPVVAGYEFITPDIAQTGVTNFFNNLAEVKYLVNNLLQGEMRDSGVTVSRFALNSTVGVLGVWDPATKMGLFVREEDFGQTLGKWGVHNGPYLVLPFFGPSTLRDTGGLAFDYAVNQGIDVLDLSDDANKDGTRIALGVLQAIDTRKTTQFRYYETGSPFEYSLVRYMYIQMRDVQIEK